MSWMWKSKVQCYFIYRHLGGSGCSVVTECLHAISIHQCILARSQTRNSRVFPFPALHFPSLCNPNCKLYQESQRVDKALARTSRCCFYQKNKKYLIQNYWLGLNSISKSMVRIYRPYFKTNYSKRAENIQSYLARSSRLSQNQRQNTTLNAHIYCLCTK